MDRLQKIFRNPKTGLSGKKELYRRIKKEHPEITQKQFDNFIENQYTYQIQKPIRKLIHYTPIISNDINDIWQIDLMDIKNVSTMNRNYKWLFVCVDVFSRFGYVIPMKDKTTSNIITAFKKILSKSKPNKVMCDNGSEFISSTFVKLCSENNIIIDYVDKNNHLTPHIGNRLGIVDRYIQTLRQRIQNYCDEYDTNNFVDVLPDLVENINSSYNSGIKAVPNEITDIDKLNIEQEMTEKFIQANKHRNFFKKGDYVRCVLNKTLFEKGSVPKWSTKVYTVEQAHLNSYTLDNGKRYKYYQLQKAVVSDDVKNKREEQRLKVRKQIRIKRILKKEGVEPERIIKRKRKRIKTDRFHY